jgi:hypothetical protein
MSAPTRWLTGPPGCPAELYLSKLRHSAFRLGRPQDAAFRRHLCATSPVLFMLNYLRDHLQLADGTVPRSVFLARHQRKADLSSGIGGSPAPGLYVAGNGVVGPTARNRV